MIARDFKNDLSSNPNTVDASEDSPVDLLVYQETDGQMYIPGLQIYFSVYTLIENFDPVEDQILVDGGKGYVRIMSDEIIAGESSNDVADFLIMGNTTIDFETSTVEIVTSTIKSFQLTSTRLNKHQKHLG